MFEWDVVVPDTPIGVTFFDGLDIPLVETVLPNGAVLRACLRDGHRCVAPGDRLVAVNHRDVSLLTTGQVLKVLADLSQRLRRDSSGGDGGGGGGAGGGRGGGHGHEIVLRFRAPTPLGPAGPRSPLTGPAWRSTSQTPGPVGIPVRG
jgi:hypothetical protein